MAASADDPRPDDGEPVRGPVQFATERQRALAMRRRPVERHEVGEPVDLVERASH